MQDKPLQATLTGKGQITLPIEIIRQMHLENGDKLVFEPVNQSLIAVGSRMREVELLLGVTKDVEELKSLETEHKALLETQRKIIELGSPPDMFQIKKKDHGQGIIQESERLKVSFEIIDTLLNVNNAMANAANGFRYVFFITGPSATGKTHLAQYIIQNLIGEDSAVYYSGKQERLKIPVNIYDANDYVTGMRLGHPDLNALDTIDALFIDEVKHAAIIKHFEGYYQKYNALFFIGQSFDFGDVIDSFPQIVHIAMCDNQVGCIKKIDIISKLEYTIQYKKIYQI